jgi:ABC-type Mn2+/Zn2+ transport system permease subunit
LLEILISNFHLFLPQIILGTLLGVLLSNLGILLVLRKMSFFGVTLSQVSTFSFALVLFLGYKGEFLPILFSIFFLVPVFYLTQSSKSKSDTILAILFVGFGSLSQILLSFGGNVQNHLLTAYFGDILTSEIKLQSFMILLIAINIILFIVFFHKILFLSFDPDEYKVRGNPKLIELLFFAIITSILSVSVNLLGSFYSAAQLIIPAFTALYLTRSLGLALSVAGILSFLSTLLGFSFSLLGWDWKGELIYFPTSSTIVVILIFMSLSLITFKKARTLFR